MLDCMISVSLQPGGPNGTGILLIKAQSPLQCMTQNLGFLTNLVNKTGMGCFGIYQRLTKVHLDNLFLSPLLHIFWWFSLISFCFYVNAGSVTKISIIPHTSLFLTGSKDGDVKLWDARGSEVELIFHWEKMHDRHTFLQPSSRGFGAVVRVIYFTSVNIVPLQKLGFESAFYLLLFFYQYMRFFFLLFKFMLRYMLVNLEKIPSFLFY